MNKHFLLAGLLTLVLAAPAVADSNNHAPSIGGAGMSPTGANSAGTSPVNANGAGTSPDNVNAAGMPPDNANGAGVVSEPMGSEIDNDINIDSDWNRRSDRFRRDSDRRDRFNTNEQLTSYGYDRREDFSDEVNHRLDRIDNRRVRLSEEERRDVGEMRRGLNKQMTRVNSIDENGWDAYRTNISDRLDQIDGVLSTNSRSNHSILVR